MQIETRVLGLIHRRNKDCKSHCVGSKRSVFESVTYANQIAADKKKERKNEHSVILEFYFGGVFSDLSGLYFLVIIVERRRGDSWRAG